jgi:hypothetical protein
MKETNAIIFTALLKLLEGLSDAQFRNVVSHAGLDIQDIHAAYVDPSSDGKQRNLVEVRNAFDRENQRSEEGAISFLRDFAIGLREHVGEVALQDTLRNHGFNFVDKRFVPLEVLDERRLQTAPALCHPDLKTAAFRISDRDYTGAITSACGAVDTLTNAIIERDGIPTRQRDEASFSSKVNTVLFKSLKVHEEIKRNMIADGKSLSDAEDAADRIRGEINYAAQKLQELRPRKSDVHGRKAATDETACEAIALSLKISELFNSKI